jgi:hypothetical protein
MRHAHGAGPHHRGHGGGAKTKDACGKRKTSSRSQASRQYAITDGQIPVGTVEVIDGRYVTLDCNGTVVGRFQTLRLAALSFPGRDAP